MSDALRKALDYVDQDQQARATNLRELDAASMNPVSRGWASGRIGLDVNAALADEASLRAAGRTAEADAAAQVATDAQERQALYAPRVGRVEDIGRSGNLLRDAGSWFGTQVGQGAASMTDPALIAAAGGALRFVPGIVGKVAPALGALGAFGYNQRQQTGEFYGNLKNDPEALRNLSPQEANQLSNLVGAGAGALDTALPGVAAHALTGGILKKGLKEGAKHATSSLGGTMLKDAGLEGLTELAQGEIGRQTLGQVNPNRDTTGDFSDRLNDFAGGAAGSAGISAPHAIAAAAQNRMLNAGNAVQAKAGEVVDMGKGAAEKATQTLKSVIDLGTEKGKSVWKDSAAQQQNDQSRLTPQEADILQAQPSADLDENGLRSWANENDIQRMGVAQSRLQPLAEGGSAEAQALLERLNSQDPVDQVTAINEATTFLLGRHEASRAGQRAAEFTAGLDEGAKKNRQGFNPVLSYDEWRAWKDKNQGVKPAAMAPKQAVEARAASERGTAMAEVLAAASEARSPGNPDIGRYVRSVGYELADMAQGWEKSSKKVPEKAYGLIDSMAGDLHDMLGQGAGEAVVRLAGLADPQTKPFFDYLLQRVDGWAGGRGERNTARTGLADQMVAMLPQEQQVEMLADGGAGARGLFQAMEMLARGRVTPARREEITKAVGGPEKLSQMLALVEPDRQEQVVDDRAAAGKGDDFEQNMSQKLVDSGAGPSAYSFARTPLQSARTPTQQNPDPFTPDAKTGARPALFNTTLADDTAVGKAAMDKKVADTAALHEGAQGAMEVKAKPLAEVFKDLGYSDEQQMALFRDYLRQENATEDAGAKADVVQAIIDGKYKHAVGVGKVRKALAQFAKDRSVVVTEQGTNRAPTEISHGAIVNMGKGGDSAMSFIRKEAMGVGKRGTPEYRKSVAQAMSKGNLLVFQSAEGKNVMGRKEGGGNDIIIPADRLVKWVRTRADQNGVSEGMPSHEAYLRDLLDGIGSIMGSGYAAQALPYMVSEDGKKLSFADGLPPNLRLGMRKVSSLQADAPTAGKLEQMRAERLAAKPIEGETRTEGESNDARQDPKHQERVAKEQDKEFFTPDDSGVNERDDTEERKDLARRTPRKAADLSDAKAPPKMHAVAAKTAERKAAQEVAADSVPKPVGAVAKAAAFRRERQQLLKDHESRVDTLARKTAAQAGTERGELTSMGYLLNDSIGRAYDLRAEGKTMQEVLNDARLQDNVGVMIKKRLAGSKVAADYIRAVLHSTEMAFAMDADSKVDQAVKAAISKSDATLASALDPIVKDSSNGSAPVVAQAVVKVAGTVPVRFGTASDLNSAGGVFKPSTGQILIDPTEMLTSTVLHEGVHAATVAGVVADEKLHKALFDLTDHVLTVAPELANAYGMTNTLEFLAEGLSNQHFQERLKKIPASSAVRKYLGENVANAWDAFVSLVRRALNLAPEHESALSQLLDLSGRAMRTTKATGIRTDGLGVTLTRPVVSNAEYGKRLEGLYAVLEKNGMEQADLDVLERWLTPAGDGGVAFSDALGVEIARRIAPQLKAQGNLNVASVMETISSAQDMKSLSLASKRNAQVTAERPVASEAEVQSAKEYLHKVLGKQIKSEFKEITGFSGEWIDAENTVRVSTITSAGVLNVARHEALHAFFSKFVKDNPKAVRVLASLTDDPRVMRRVEALLKDEPAALAQLKDGEERLAYIYQFAMAGVLRLPHTPGTTLMGQVRKFLRRVFQMVTDQERAVDLLYAFEHGKMSEPSAAARAIAKTLDQGTWLKAGTKYLDPFQQRMAALVLPSNEILAKSSSPTAQKLAKMFFTNPGEEGALGEKGEPGYLNSRNEMMRRYDNAFRATIEGLDDRQRRELIEAMQNETVIDKVRDPDVAASKMKLHSLFERFHRYMKDEKGLAIGKIRENYFPVVWDSQKLQDDPQPFKSMLLTKYAGNISSMVASWEKTRQAMIASGKTAPADPITPEFVADEIVRRLTWNQGVDDAAVAYEPRQDGVLRPWMAAGEERTLNFLKPEDRAPFLEKDLITTLSRYVRQGVRTAEYASRFGRTGGQLEKMLETTRNELEEVSHRMLKEGDLKDEKARADWVRRQHRDVANAAGAMEGTLGADINPTLRKINSWSVVYQNVRLLPLALFSSFVDPLGIIARGGEAKEAFTAFVDGMKGVARQWGDLIREEPAARQKEQFEKLAEDAGVIDAAIFSHMLADEYGSVFMDNTAKRINEAMFKANGMDAWNRAMRVGATRAAVRFMERHYLKPGEHSKRWLADLGLGDMRLPMDEEGHLITSKSDLLAKEPDMELAEAEQTIGRIHHAINRWVEGAILSPNAAQRPAWGSDPHYGMFWHLKQFAYSFQQTIMKRALNEAKHGNVMPLGVFAWYVPTMIASDVTRGLLVGGGDLPAYMKGYDLGDWMVHGVNRSGILGMGQVAIDTAQHPLSVGGPMFEQVADVFIEPVEQNIVRALPVNALYRGALQ